MAHVGGELGAQHRGVGVSTPSAQCFVGAAGDDALAVWAKRHAVHLVLVAGERLATGLAGVGVPQTHGGVVTAGGDAVPVGTERHTAHLDRVAGMGGGVAEDTDAVDQAVAPLMAEGLSVLSG